MAAPSFPRPLAATFVALFVLACSAPVTNGPSTSAGTTTTTRSGGTPLPEPTGDVDQVEMLVDGDGRLVVAWTTLGDEGDELWLAVLGDGPASGPTMITERATDIPLEEMRPSLAFGPDGLVGVAWTSIALDVYVALSEDGGATFGPPFRLNLDATGLQVLPVIAFDRGGALHAVWLDPRAAPAGAEEPADLYLGVLAGDQYVETSLTAGQTPSVCGCCRPRIEIIDDRVTVTFRNTTEDGYRDPYQISFDTRAPSGSPEPVAPPTWKISACPVAGPVAFGDDVVWLDGSVGSPRILSARGPQEPPDIVIESSDGFRVTAAPRIVTGTTERMLLVPGSPNSRLLVDHDGNWDVSTVELPPWATGAAVWEGRLLVVGATEGSLVHEFHDLP